MVLWSPHSGLQVEIGVLSLGDVWVPLFDPGTRLPSQAQHQATTYRAEQSAGWLRLLLRLESQPGSAHLLCERRVSTSGDRAGAERVRLRCDLTEDGTLRVDVVDQATMTERVDSISLDLSEVKMDDLNISVPDSARDAWQRRCVEAELFVRWLRSLLREQPSRRAIRDRFDSFVILCDSVESSLRAEEHEGLERALDALCFEAKPLAEGLGVPFFPIREAAIFMPET